MKSDYFGKTLVQIVANLAILEYCRKMATFDKILLYIYELWLFWINVAFWAFWLFFRIHKTILRLFREEDTRCKWHN